MRQRDMIVLVGVLGLGYWWWKKQQAARAAAVTGADVNVSLFPHSLPAPFQSPPILLTSLDNWIQSLSPTSPLSWSGPPAANEGGDTSPFQLMTE